MSDNWLCCDKHLRELKKISRITIRLKDDHSSEEEAEYDPVLELLLSDLDNPVVKYWVNPNDYKRYEFIMRCDNE